MNSSKFVRFFSTAVAYSFVFMSVAFASPESIKITELINGGPKNTKIILKELINHQVKTVFDAIDPTALQTAATWSRRNPVAQIVRAYLEEVPIGLNEIPQPQDLIALADNGIGVRQIDEDVCVSNGNSCIRTTAKYVMYAAAIGTGAYVIAGSLFITAVLHSGNPAAIINLTF